MRPTWTPIFYCVSLVSRWLFVESGCTFVGLVHTFIGGSDDYVDFGVDDVDYFLP